MGQVTPAQIAQVKARGFLWNRGSTCFNARAVAGNGVYTSEQLRLLADCAEKYGNGTAALTTRLTIEMSGVPYDHIETLEQALAGSGMMIGGTGAKIRPVVACKGTTCVYGNFDTQALAKEIHEKYFLGWQQVKLPHKFKIAVGGCPNSCMKPSLNDFGIEGHRTPHLSEEICRSCKKCMVEEKCPMHAAIRPDGGQPQIDRSVCTSCGVCTRSCPFHAMLDEGQEQYAIYVGGTWGKKTRMANRLPGYFSREELFPMLEKTLLWFKENAYQKERLGAAIDRLGVDKLEHDLLEGDLLARKQEILAAEIQVRG